MQAVPGRRESGGRYGLLLLFLIGTYVFSAFNGAHLTTEVQIGLFVVVLLLAMRSSPLPGRWPLIVSACAIIGSVGAFAAAISGTPAGQGAAELWKALLLLMTAVMVIRRVLAKPTVTVQSLYGAISAYLIIGLMFAASYAAIYRLENGTDFFASDQPTNTQTLQYFSFTTLTTLGYGDFTAARNGGRSIAVLEAMTGQVFLATLVARLVSAYQRPTPRIRPEDDDGPDGDDENG
jgi:Ion channel